MTQAAIKKLVADSVSAALEAQAITMANADNTNRNTGPRETPIARKCSYKEFMSSQPYSFKGTEGDVGLIHWIERTESVLSRSNCTDDCKVKFATGTLTKEALSWWNSFTQPIGIEEAYNISWNRYCLKASNSGEEAITITQRLIDQVTKHNSVQGTNDHKQKFDDRRTFTNNNYQNNRNNNNNNRNNDHHQQKNRRTLNCQVSDLQQEGHYKNQCPKANNSAHGRAYMLRDKNVHQDPNVVTGTFLLNQHLARVLFDSGADKSFVSISLASMLNIPPITLDTTYDIEWPMET
ncbi:hypothetical protein Tco_1468776 [Tanacetum coccineum]